MFGAKPLKPLCNWSSSEVGTSAYHHARWFARSVRIDDSDSSAHLLHFSQLTPIRSDHLVLATDNCSRHFNQLHLSVALTMQHHHHALRIAEDKNIAVFKVGFFDRLFKRHGTHRDRFF